MSFSTWSDPCSELTIVSQCWLCFIERGRSPFTPVESSSVSTLPINISDSGQDSGRNDNSISEWLRTLLDEERWTINGYLTKAAAAAATECRWMEISLTLQLRAVYVLALVAMRGVQGRLSPGQTTQPAFLNVNPTPIQRRTPPTSYLSKFMAS